MDNITAQKEIARMLASAGMDAQSAAMHTAMLNVFTQQNPKIGALVQAAQKSDDAEYKAQVVKSLLNRVSELIVENPEMVKHALS